MPAHPLPPALLRPLVTAKPETLWRTVFEQSHLGIVLIDPATDRIIDLNQRFADLAGRSRDALRGQDWMHLTHPDDLPLEIEHKTQLRQGQIPCFLRDKRYVHPDGSVVWVHVNETRATVAEGEPPCFLAMVEDVTEQRQTRLALRAEREAAARYEQERALRQTQELLQMAERAAGAGAWDWDMRTERLNWSPALFQLFGLDPQHAPPNFDTWRALVHPDDLPDAELALEESIREHRPFVASYRIVLTSGEVRWIDAYGQVSYDASGEPVHFTGLCIDASLRHHTEAQIRQLNAELAMSDPAQDDQDAAVQMADARLYAAKQGGRNRVVHRDPANG